MRLVLDEQLDAAFAVELRRRGHDVIAVTEDVGLRGLDDGQLFAWAVAAGRAIVTYDAADFVPLSEEREAAGEPFPGVIFLSSKRYSQRPQSRGALVRDLARLMDAKPERDALEGRSVWLGSDD